MLSAPINLRIRGSIDGSLSFLGRLRPGSVTFMLAFALWWKVLPRTILLPTSSGIFSALVAWLSEEFPTHCYNRSPQRTLFPRAAPGQTETGPAMTKGKGWPAASAINTSAINNRIDRSARHWRRPCCWCCRSWTCCLTPPWSQLQALGEINLDRDQRPAAGRAGLAPSTSRHRFCGDTVASWRRCPGRSVEPESRNISDSRHYCI